MRGVRSDPERREIRTLRRHVSFDGRRIVEVGIGRGRLTRRFLSRAGMVIGIDVVPAYLASARAIAMRRPDRIALARATATALPVRSRSVDVVLLSWSL